MCLFILNKCPNHPLPWVKWRQQSFSLSSSSSSSSSASSSFSLFFPDPCWLDFPQTMKLPVLAWAFWVDVRWRERVGSQEGMECHSAWGQGLGRRGKPPHIHISKEEAKEGLWRKPGSFLREASWLTGWVGGDVGMCAMGWVCGVEFPSKNSPNWPVLKFSFYSHPNNTGVRAEKH